MKQTLLYAAAAVGVGLMAWAQIAGRSDSGYLFDFYPLYRGAEALLTSGDAYAVQATGPAPGGAAAIGNSYPIHAVLLLGLPFAWMPPGVAVIAWTLAVGLAWILAVRWARESPYWFLWIPMWQALLLQQPAAALGVAAIVAWGSLGRGAPWALAAALVVLTMKPQQFLLLAVVLAWWGRAWWRQIAVTFAAVAVGSFLAQPDWIARWLERVQVRAELVPVVWVGPLLIPVGVIVFWRGWRASGLAIASSAVGPWPTVGGYYAAVAWPLGSGRTQSAALALLGILGFVVGEVMNGSMAFVVFVGLGAIVAAMLAPDRRPSGPRTRSVDGLSRGVGQSTDPSNDLREDGPHV